jgi:hypothetical protein
MGCGTRHRPKVHLIPECRGCGKPFYAADPRCAWCSEEVCQRAKEKAHRDQSKKKGAA